MKRIILITFVLISIPFFVVCFYRDINVKEELIRPKYMSSVNVRVKRVNKDRIDNIYIEDYVIGVVSGEMPVSFEFEALKAQAVASRSYVLKKIYDNKDSSYDVLDTTLNQVYLDNDDLRDKWKDNYANYINKVIKAVNETSLEYLEYDGKVANTMFFSTSNGYTEDSMVFFSEDIPYLRSVPSSWDSSVNSNFLYSKRISLDEFYRLLGLVYSDRLVIDHVKRSNSNRVVSIMINGKLFSGKDIYDRLKIRSVDFNIVRDNDNVVIETKGFGHGVGMSQYGAHGMAIDGYNYKEILEYYYKGTILKKI